MRGYDLRTVMSLAVCAAAFLATAAVWAAGGGDCCQSCGCQCACDKVCKVICEKKIVTKTKYCCECEDFCVPGPSCLIGRECVDDCNAPHGVATRNIWQPGRATIRTRKKLVKKTYTEEVPTYKWVVESCCPRCQGKLPAEQAALLQEIERSGATLPAAPAGYAASYSH